MKHVIAAEVKEDNLKGICTGEGRIKVRLNEGETINQVRLNFVRAGFSVNVHKDDPRKRPDLTGPPKDAGEAKFLNAKEKKAHELQTKHWEHHQLELLAPPQPLKITFNSKSNK